MAMSKKDRQFYESCDTFKNYANIDDYKADIRRWLMLSSWHYTGEEADNLMTAPNRAEWIKRAFEEREPVSDIASDVGFCCG